VCLQQSSQNGNVAAHSQVEMTKTSEVKLGNVPVRIIQWKCATEKLMAEMSFIFVYIML